MNPFHRRTTVPGRALAGALLAALPALAVAQDEPPVRTVRYRDANLESLPPDVLAKLAEQMTLSKEPRYFLDTTDSLSRSTDDETRPAPGLAKNNYIGKVYEIHNTDAIHLQSYLLRIVAYEGGAVEVMGQQGVVDAAGKPVQYIFVTVPDFMVPGIDEIVDLCDRKDFEFYDQTGMYFDSESARLLSGSEVETLGKSDKGLLTGAEIYVGKHRTASELRSILASTELGNVGALFFPPFADDSTNSLYIVENPIDMADNFAALQKFDKPPMQLTLSVDIYEIQEGDRQRLGLDYDVWKRALSGSLDYESTGETQWFDPQADLWTTVLSLDASVLADFLNFTAQSGTSKVLTSTKLTMVNSEDVPGGVSGGARGSLTGVPAVVSSLTAIPFTSTAPGSDGGRSEVLDIETAAEGVVVEILPFIAKESATLSIKSEVLSLSGFTKETDQPIISSRTVNSVVNVKDGVPIVLGGLEKTNNVTSTVGLPFLKDIPVLKYAFGKEVKDTTQSKILIVLKPDIVSAEEGNVAALF